MWPHGLSRSVWESEGQKTITALLWLQPHNHTAFNTTSSWLSRTVMRHDNRRNQAQGAYASQPIRQPLSSTLNPDPDLNLHPCRFRSW